MNISPRDIHALWLVLKEAKGQTEACVCVAAQQILQYADTNDISRLIQTGEFLGLLKHETDRSVVTDVGRQFGKADHWRLWEPSPEVAEYLVHTDNSHLFIDPRIYKNRPIVIDLFAGVGGLSVGFTAAGFNVALAVDNDKQACESHKLNFPDTIVLKEDVGLFAEDPTKYLQRYLPLAQLKIAGIIGGPPCQGFSVAGERSTTDERKLLTSKFLDAILLLKPDFFVMENVPGLMTDGARPLFSTYLGRVSNSNGEPATAIIEKLPEPTNKRDRNYRKKLVSVLIRGFHDLADQYFEANVMAPSTPQQTILELQKQFEGLVRNEIADVFTDQSSVDTCMNDISADLAAIIVSSVYRRLAKSNKTPQRNQRQIFDQLVQLFPDENTVQQAFIRIGASHDAIPTTKKYKGQDVGPLLWDLIARAGEIYDVATPQVLNAASYGTPQDRDRLFFVGIKKSLNTSFSFPEATHHFKGTKNLVAAIENQAPTAQDAIGDLPDIDTMVHLIKDHEFSTKHLEPTTAQFALRMRLDVLDRADFSLPRASWNPYLVNCSNRTTHDTKIIERLKILLPGKRDKISRKARLHPEMLSHTLRAGTKENKGSHTAVRPVHYAYNRVISVREGARLMGYPDWMTFHATKWHGFRLVGNGVPMPLAQAIAKQIMHLVYTTP